ncbi:hypothetical protein LOC71_10635 [Rhodopirellula sp. JC740]|uniref:Tetratricopeptide repeat protein n=1 Tax=Rhodopirellula halodulae TaxID=2894198 RepID=A0ABS8NIV8_9BACT|nr:hypothetical protein [Rhodopirellula sp. JC740]MCC9642733.1 hypothetical protein [Rhodopirellula sp. JC740]
MRIQAPPTREPKRIARPTTRRITWWDADRRWAADQRWAVLIAVGCLFSPLAAIWDAGILGVGGFVGGAGNGGWIQSASADSEWLSTVPIADDEEIAALIEGLGADSYATRVRSRQQLSRIGLAAFDALRRARYHPDNEVAIVARKLTSDGRVQWAISSDSDEVREILAEFSSRTVMARKQRISRLASLPIMESFPALVRVARFEPESSLSRFAALALLAQPVREMDGRENGLPANLNADGIAKDEESRWKGLSEHDRSLMAKHLDVVFEEDPRISSQWLKQYANELTSGLFDPQAWTDLIEQMEIHWQTDPAENSQWQLGVVTGDELFHLTWLNAERALVLGQSDEAASFFIRHIDVIPSRTRELTDAALWAIDHQLFDVVTAAHAKHRSLFEKSPPLLYASAEALLRSDQPELAQQRAEMALKLNPVVNADEEDAPQLHPVLLENNEQAHLRSAADLLDRGLYDWAQAEYRMMVDQLPLANISAAMARTELAEHLAELQRPAEVVEVLQPLVERMEKDDSFRHRYMAHDFDYQSLRSLLDFQAGLDLAAKQDPTAASKRLQAAFEMDTENIDILIAMYRLEWDEPWKESVVARIESVLSEIDEDIAETQETFRQTGNGRSGRQVAIRDLLLANFYNQYAWLVSNTEGDYEKALQRSIRSLELSPGSEALLDTCGRCYYAAGNLPAAIRTQRRAVQLTPHSPPLQRQLKLFETSWLDANPGKTLDELPEVTLPIAEGSAQERTDRQRRLGVVPPDGPLSFLNQ